MSSWCGSAHNGSKTNQAQNSCWRGLFSWFRSSLRWWPWCSRSPFNENWLPEIYVSSQAPTTTTTPAAEALGAEVARNASAENSARSMSSCSRDISARSIYRGSLVVWTGNGPWIRKYEWIEEMKQRKINFFFLYLVHWTVSFFWSSFFWRLCNRNTSEVSWPRLFCKTYD